MQQNSSTRTEDELKDKHNNVERKVEYCILRENSQRLGSEGECQLFRAKLEDVERRQVGTGDSKSEDILWFLYYVI